jgi:quercetin dioxygenase-like cupin family protein
MNFQNRVRVVVMVGALVSVFMPGRVAADETSGTPIVATVDKAKFSPIHNAPPCFTVAVEKGDPSKGPSVILAKFARGCIAPWHWHTPIETVMVVSGALEVQMKGDPAFIGHGGDFVDMPGRHVHRATCQGSEPCLVFISSNAPFDIHWVDEDGREITLEAALKNKKAK